MKQIQIKIHDIRTEHTTDRLIIPFQSVSLLSPIGKSSSDLIFLNTITWMTRLRTSHFASKGASIRETINENAMSQL